MDISYKWLKRYIDINVEPRALAALLTSTGLECDTVEEVETIRGGLRGVVIGKVLTCTEHPDSDHLHITTVDLGGEAPVQIVCGAPNVTAGQTVVVATVGTTLYDGDKEFKIKKSKIRGVESFGMICAEDELGLGTDHAGIIVLQEDVKPGTPAADYYNIESDFRLEVELTPNRVDAASHYGVARDVKARQWCDIALSGSGAEYPEISVPDVSSFSIDRPEGGATVTVVDRGGCPRYSGITVRGVKVAESPEWLRNLLLAAGQRPINNIVDITNFILLGIGQPLHSFDLSKVKGEHIVVRTCPAGTKFTTLDGTERTIHESDLMICDDEKPMCIAGVFGGLDSGVTETTTDVFIESAYFNPTRVRRTARRHGLSTDASFRYERGTDPNITLYAARLAAILIREIAGGEICGPLVDDYPEPVKPVEIDFSIDYCNRLIGKAIGRDLIITILRALEFGVTEGENPDLLRLTVPTYRVDVTRPCDVVEEVLRIYGYNNVEISEEAHLSLSQRTAVDASHDMLQTVCEQLTARGFMEIMNNSLTAASYYSENPLMPIEGCVRVMNPLSSDLSVLRRTLLYGGLESISHNIRRKAADLKFYEYGNVYSFDASKAGNPEHPLAAYSEHPELALWMTGSAHDASWNVAAAEVTVYDLKGAVDSIFARMGIPAAMIVAEQGKDELFSAKLTLSTRQGKLLGEVGILSRETLRSFDIERDVVYAWLDWNALMRISSGGKVVFAEIARTQPVERDLALLIDKSVKFADIAQAIRKAERKLLRGVSLFDVYEGKNLPAGKKSYAVKMIFQDSEKTLTDKQTDAAMERIIKAVRDLGAELR